MSSIAEDLRNMGFTRTDRASPFVEGGQLWANSHELVCDETGYVIRSPKDTIPDSGTVAELSDDTPRYNGSNRVILPGGNSSVYEYE